MRGGLARAVAGAVDREPGADRPGERGVGLQRPEVVLPTATSFGMVRVGQLDPQVGGVASSGG